MKKPILTAALALAISAGAIAPAHAQDRQTNSTATESPGWFTSNPIYVLIGLLLPAVQRAH